LQPKNQKTRRLISIAFAVLCAVGSRLLRAAGFVPMMLFTSDAKLAGTLSTREGYVRDADINGERPTV